jgi:NADH-quinone oxidoreductase subunit N
MTLSAFLVDLQTILPLVVLMTWACALLIIDLFIPDHRKAWTALLSGLGLLVTLGILLAQAGQGNKVAFGGMASVDGFALFYF